MAKQSEEKSFFESLRKAPDNVYFKTLLALLNSRLTTVKNQLVTAEDSEYKKLQGRAVELDALIIGLTRKPVTRQKPGAFN